MSESKSQRERAIALQYKSTDEIPHILASGVGEVAQAILRLAQKFEVPVHRDEALTEMLAKLPAGTVISPESYRLVAEVICFLYQMDKDWRAKHAELDPVLGHSSIQANSTNTSAEDEVLDLFPDLGF